MKKMSFSYTSQPILTVGNNIKKENIHLSPSFQRGYIWKNEFKDELLVSIMSNYPIGNIILFKNNDILEVVDGQQRLTTIINFIGYKDEKYIIRGKSSVEKIKVIASNYYRKLKNNLTVEEENNFIRTLKSKSISYDELPEIIKDDIMSYNLNITTISGTTHETIVEYFKYVQNQETLKAGEIINSIYIYNQDLNFLISQIKNKDLLIRSLNIVNSRRDFEKHFINFVGVLNRKIALNSTSSKIVSFAQNFEKSAENKYVFNLINNLNTFIDYFENDKNEFKIKLGARGIKVLFSYLSFEEVNYNEVENILNLLIDIEKNIKQGNNLFENITFIETKARNFEDIKESAYNFNLRLKGGSND